MAQAFARSKALMALIVAAMSAGNTNLIGVNTAYRSRGHGMGKCSGKKKANGSSHMPHQGDQEKARRVRQLQAGFIRLN